MSMPIVSRIRSLTEDMGLPSAIIAVASHVHPRDRPLLMGRM
jgi:hypothetical protein